MAMVVMAMAVMAMVVIAMVVMVTVMVIVIVFVGCVHVAGTSLGMLKQARLVWYVGWKAVQLCSLNLAMANHSCRQRGVPEKGVRYQWR